MTTAAGKIDCISTKDVSTKFGVKPAYSANIGGQWFDFGFTKPRFNEGDAVSFEYVEGTYGKKVDSKSVVVNTAGKTASGAPPAPSFNGKSFPIPPLHPDRSIVRQNSLTNAREMICSLFLPLPSGDLQWEETADMIIKVARKFEAYSCGDLDVERAKELVEKDLKS